MSSEERPYPPSDQKLAKLRSEGAFPRTREFFVLASFGALLFTVTTVPPHYALNFFESQFRSAPTELSLWSSQLFSLTLGALLKVIALQLAIAVVLTLLFGLFQSKFLLLPFPRFDLARAFSGLSGWGSGVGRRTRRAFQDAAQLVAVLAVCYLCGISLMSKLSSSSALVPRDIPFDSQLAMNDKEITTKGIAAQSGMLTLARTQIDTAHRQLLTSLGTLFAFAVLLAVICRFISVLAFRAAHGMSREELQAELRESEASPALRSEGRNRQEEE